MHGDTLAGCRWRLTVEQRTSGGKDSFGFARAAIAGVLVAAGEQEDAPPNGFRARCQAYSGTLSLLFSGKRLKGWAPSEDNARPPAKRCEFSAASGTGGRHFADRRHVGSAVSYSFSELRQQMGADEAVALALACHKGWVVTSDYRKALHREATSRLEQARVLRRESMSLLSGQDC